MQTWAKKASLSVILCGFSLSALADIRFFWLDRPGGRNNPDDPMSATARNNAQAKLTPVICPSPSNATQAEAEPLNLSIVAQVLGGGPGQVLWLVSVTPSPTMTPNVPDLKWPCPTETWYQVPYYLNGEYAVTATQSALDQSILTIYDPTMNPLTSTSGSGNLLLSYASPVSVSAGTVGFVPLAPGAPYYLTIEQSISGPGQAFHGSLSATFWEFCHLCPIIITPLGGEVVNQSVP